MVAVVAAAVVPCQPLEGVATPVSALLAVLLLSVYEEVFCTSGIDTAPCAQVSWRLPYPLHV